MIELKFYINSLIDSNIASAINDSYAWIDYLERLPGVKSAEYNIRATETTITFDSEEDKTFFILKWS